MFLSKQNGGGFLQKSLVKILFMIEKVFSKYLHRVTAFSLVPSRATDPYLFAACQWAASELMLCTIEVEQIFDFNKIGKNVGLIFYTV